MRRLHVIEDFDRVGGEIYYRESEFMHDPELHKAYLCGVKQGWREAMKEVDRGEYAERHYPTHGGRILYREHDHEWDDDYSERRRRDARGRYM